MNIVMRVGGSLGTAVATVVLQQALSHHEARTGLRRLETA